MSMLQVNQRLAAITAAGTSIWLDEIRRGLIESGELRRLVEEDSLRGVTSNPTIFNRAILGSEDYDDQIVELALRGTLTRAIYQELVISDIQQACDVLRDVYDATGRHDGYVSLEVDPDLAFDTERTMAQAREYSERVDRPNLMIKIPGTPEGLPAIEEMIYEGHNINVTLLFAVSEYERVMEAYIRGLERRQAEAVDVDVRSVASFFVSRVDTEVDRRLEDLGRTDLFARAGLANARAAYRRFTAVFDGERFAALREAGAPVQRPLWASTQVKDPNYPDTMYVEGLVGPETVNTMPMATLLAAGDHARVDPEHPTVLIDPEPDLRALAEAGIDLDDVTARLLTEGVEKFVAPFEELMAAIERRREAIAMARPPAIQGSIPDQLEPRIALRVQRAVEEDTARRIWRKDASLWGDPDQPELADRLGWVTVPEQMREEVDELEAFADQIRDEGITDVLLLGMGGSSLAPEVIRRSFGDQDGRPRLRVLDSTDPAALRAVEAAIDLHNTLFVVSTKSGGTIETFSLLRHFLGRRPHGDAFVAITDPGSGLEQLAYEHGFRRTFLNDPEIGGRYSALSYFGMVPAALMGADVRALLDSAGVAEQDCQNFDAPSANSGLWPGLALGELAAAGRDKLTYVIEPPLESFGLWLEQLVAESTGKQGKGIVPVVDEPLGPPEVYGDDRVIAYYCHAEAPDERRAAAVEALARADQPLIVREMGGPADLGRLFYFSEFAVATAGWVLGINPFDQPNVQEAKDATARALTDGAPDQPGAREDELRALLDGLGPPSYFALLAFVAPSPEFDAAAAELRATIRDATGAATTFGYGPRYLHSTGQLHKGGPPTGRFLQVMHDAGPELEIPGAGYGFARLKHAQAIGDLEALRARALPAERVTLEDDDAAAGLRALTDRLRRLL
jgi:transaldolase / glucose-6-phosphate isomerase